MEEQRGTKGGWESKGHRGGAGGIMGDAQEELLNNSEVIVSYDGAEYCAIINMTDEFLQGYNL